LLLEFEINFEVSFWGSMPSVCVDGYVIDWYQSFWLKHQTGMGRNKYEKRKFFVIDFCSVWVWGKTEILERKILKFVKKIQVEMSQYFLSSLIDLIWRVVKTNSTWKVEKKCILMVVVVRVKFQRINDPDSFLNFF